MKNFSNKIKKLLFPKKLSRLTLVLIFFLALGLRLFGLNWDQKQHLHPDERFLTMVATSIKMPQSLGQYLDPKISPMNPYNLGYQFFVYGTFPLYLTKVAGVLTGWNNYESVHLLGRMLSAFFDLGVVFLVFKIGQKLFNQKTGLWTAFFYSIMVLPIQLSHFFAVDTFLNFFLVFCFYLLLSFLQSPRLVLSFALGLVFGLALACKISALYFLPIIGLGYLYLFIQFVRRKKKERLLLVFFSGLTFLLASYLTLRIAQPAIFANANFFNFQPNPQFLDNLKQLKALNQPDTWFPPAIQWKKTQPLLFPLKNLIFWGLGLPLGLVSMAGFLNLTFVVIRNCQKKLKSNKVFFQTLVLLWIAGLFFYQGSQFCKTMRYFLPIYPFLALVSGFLVGKILNKIGQKNKKIFPFVLYSLFVILSIYSLSFISIYTRPVTRVAASEWIYRYLPAGSTLANEYWDDPLPLYLPKKNPGQYKIEMLSLYDPETPEKWEKINSQLERTDYIVLSSNRLYGSIPRHSEYYPETSLYYQSLFDGSLGFEKIAEFTSYPCFPPIGPQLFCLPDDWAEEAFTVYDHPKVIIFEKTASL